MKKIFKDKRCNIISLIIAIILSLFQVLGNSIEKYMSLEGILKDGSTIISSIAIFCGYTIILFYTILLLYKIVLPKILRKTDKDYQFFTANKRSFFVVAIFIFAMYIPYFLNEFPGIISTDSLAEILQAMGYRTLENHYPIAHIGLISIAMNIGKLIGNYNIGIAIYSIFQMILTACVFSYTIYFMAKYKVNKAIRIITLLIYAFYPPFAIYAVTMWKDVPFALFMTIYVTFLIEMAINSEIIKSKNFNIKFVIIMIMVFLFRNNGIYVLLLSMPFVIGIHKKYRKKLIILYLIVFVTYAIFTGPIFKIFNIKKSDIRETLSVPLQQFARVWIENKDTLTEEEKELIKTFLPGNDIEQVYNPICSDPIKAKFSNSIWNEKKIEFVELCAKMWIKYPQASLEALLCNSYGYWYPNTKGCVSYYDFRKTSDIVDRENTDSRAFEMEYEKKPILKIGICDYLKLKTDEKGLNVENIWYSIGFIFWLFLISYGYVIYRKKYKLSVAYIPIIALWLTTLASPLAIEYRYLYSLFTSFPIIAIATIEFANKEERKSIKGEI